MKKNGNGNSLVSIIIPVYNHEKYLDDCVKSVLNQSYRNIELLIINDGSTDNSRKICEKYAQLDRRIKLINQENRGPSAARNRGLEKSIGDFIFFQDSDDIIVKNAIERLIEYYNQHKSEIIIGNFNNNSSNGIVEKRKDVIHSKDKLLNKQDLIDYARLYLKKPNRYLLFAFSWGRLFKASIIKKYNIRFNEKLHTYEDVDFNFNYLKSTNSVFFLRKIVYSHNINNYFTSATMSLGTTPKKLLGYKQALVSISNFLKNNISHTEIKKEVGHADIFLTIIQLVRACGQINNLNKSNIYNFVKDVIHNLNLQNNLKYYSPDKGDSKIFPYLIKLKLVWPIIMLCEHKARQRYGKSSRK